MSDLNFRAWHRVLGRYLADDEWFMGVHGEPYSGYSDGKFITNWQSDYELDTDITIEQSTNLKDKNGRKIYDGDIIRNTEEVAPNKSKTYQVFYKVDFAKFDVAPVDGKIDILSGGFNFASMTHYEIIGNRHENKELLEEE